MRFYVYLLEVCKILRLIISNDKSYQKYEYSSVDCFVTEWQYELQKKKLVNASHINVRNMKDDVNLGSL